MKTENKVHEYIELDIPNKINYIPHDEKCFTMRCLECGDERIEAFQCDCGKKFCRNCHPDSFVYDDEFGCYTGLVTCPTCGATTVFV